MREHDGDAWPVYIQVYTGIQVHVPVLPALGQLAQLAFGDGHRCSSPLNEAKGISVLTFVFFSAGNSSDRAVKFSLKSTCLPEKLRDMDTAAVPCGDIIVRNLV